MFSRASTLRKILRQRADTLRVPGPLRRTIRQVRARNLTYLSPSKLNQIARLASSNERRKVPGLIIETGCALGGSSILLAASKTPERPLKIFDVFGMIPEPSERDGTDVRQRYEEIRGGLSSGIGGDVYYGYRDDLYESVRENLEAFGFPPEQHNIELIKGLIEETLTIDEPISLAHVDVDWYRPVRVSLERIVPRLSPGGTIIIDDYFDWSGCRQAVDEYFATRKRAFRFDDSAGSLAITKR